MDAIALKTSNQNIIERYRQNVADFDSYLENIIKKIDAIDIGSGLNCLQKLDAIDSIQNEFEAQGIQKLNDLKQNAQKVIEIINNLDAQQVEEKLKSSDRRYNDIIKRVARKAQMITATNKSIQSVQNEIIQLGEWLTEQNTLLHEHNPLNADSTQLNINLQKLKAISKDADVKQVLADTLERRVATLKSDLEPLEKSQFDSDLLDIRNNQKQLSDLIISEMNKTTDALQQLKSFESDVDKYKAWLRTKLVEIKKKPSTIPLTSTAVESEIQAVKITEAENLKDGNDLLNEIQKKAQSMSKQYSNQKCLEPMLEILTNEFVELKNEPVAILNHLTEAFNIRKTFENDVSKIDDWLSEVEISTQSDVQFKSLPILKEQLLEFEKLKNQKEQMRPILTELSECSKLILPTLNNVDKMKLNEQIKSLKDKFNKPIVNERIKAIEDHIKKGELSKEKLAECMDILNKLQQEIRNLNKPFGIDANSVKDSIKLYDRILKELNNNKTKLNSIQMDDLAELPSVLSRNDETERAVEKQISNLIQAQNVREQYAALVDQIEAMIGTLTVQIASIDISEKPIEDKLSQYDEMISKIQECEGILASVQDRGQKIAAEGTVADGNAITENNQNIKQKLQNMHHQIKTQRQKYENTIAEYNKLASDLTELLLWLHNNETSCKSRPYLERDPGSVAHEINKHDTFSKEVQMKLDEVQRIDEETKDDGNLPASIIDMLSEGRSLNVNLPKELSNRRQFLEDHKQYRNDYIKYVNEFKNWIHQAEGYLEHCKHGIDFKNIVSNIDTFNSFFENDRPVRELITEKIQSIVDHIWPTLQTIDQNELSEELRQHKKLLDSTLNSGKKQRAILEKHQVCWNSYRDMFNSLQNIIETAQVETHASDSLTSIKTNLVIVSNTLADLKVNIYFWILLFIYRRFLSIPNNTYIYYKLDMHMTQKKKFKYEEKTHFILPSSSPK